MGSCGRLHADYQRKQALTTICCLHLGVLLKGRGWTSVQARVSFLQLRHRRRYYGRVLFASLLKELSVGINFAFPNVRNNSASSFLISFGVKLFPSSDGFDFLFLGQSAPYFRPHVTRSSGFLELGGSPSTYEYPTGGRSHCISKKVRPVQFPENSISPE